MLPTSGQPIFQVIQQHAEEAAFLRNARSFLVRAPHVKLHHLRRFDDRLAANLDGLAVAGEWGWRLCKSLLANPSIGEVFTATVRAIEDRNELGLNELIALAAALNEFQPGFVSAFGWVSAQFLQGTIKELLASNNPFERQVALAACAMHRTDPGFALKAALEDNDASLRAYGLRVSGLCARRDLLTPCVEALMDDDAACRFAAACSVALLGDGDDAIAILTNTVLGLGPNCIPALQLLLKFLDHAQSHALLKTLAQEGANVRVLIQGIGIAKCISCPGFSNRWRM